MAETPYTPASRYLLMHNVLSFGGRSGCKLSKFYGFMRIAN